MGIKRRQRRGKHYYVVTYGLHHTEDGKPRYHERWLHTRADAIAFEREHGGQPRQAIEQATIRDLAEEWQRLHVSTLSKRTQRDYQTQLKRRILPHLGAVKVQRLQPAQVGAWLRTIGVQHPRSANKALGALKAMIRWGRANGYTTNRAADDIKKLKQPPVEQANPHTPQEVKDLAEAMHSLRDRTIIYLAAYSGLRFSELRALHWDAIILDDEVAHVNWAMDADRSLKPTKNERRRSVPVLEPGVDALREWWSASGEPAEGLLFTTREGRALPHDWYRNVREVVGRPVKLHELRDTYASLLIAAGVSELELTLWLGHTSVELTLQRYAKLFAPRKAKLARAANRLLRDWD